MSSLPFVDHHEALPSAGEAKSAWKVFTETVEIMINPLAQMSDDIMASIKDYLPMSESSVHAVIGGAFGLVCLLETYHSIKELSKDYEDYEELRRKKERKGMDEQIETEEYHLKIRIAKHTKTFSFASGGLGLSLGLIIGATTSLSVVGAAFFPFAIMAALTLDSAINFYHCHSECRRIEQEIRELEEKERNLSSITRTVLHHPSREDNDLNKRIQEKYAALHQARVKRNVEACETVGSIIVTASLAITTFTAFLAASTATMGILPIALAVIGLAIIISAKVYEKFNEKKEILHQQVDVNVAVTENQNEDNKKDESLDENRKVKIDITSQEHERKDEDEDEGEGDKQHPQPR